MKTIVHYRVIPSQEIRAYHQGPVEESHHLDALVARQRAELLAWDAAKRYREVQNAEGWRMMGDCAPTAEPTGVIGSRPKPTHRRFMRWISVQADLEARTLTLKPGAIVKGERLTEPLTWSTGDQFGPDGEPQNVSVVVPLITQDAYVPLVRRAEMDGDEVVREWLEPTRDTPADEDLRGEPRCREEKRFFCGIRREEIHWAVTRPPKWRHGLVYYTLVPGRNMTMQGPWPSYPTLLGAKRAARFLAKAAARTEPPKWERVCTLSEMYCTSQASMDLARERPLDVLYRAVRWENSVGDVEISDAAVKVQMTCFVAETTARVTVHGRMVDGALVDRVEKEEPLPSLDAAAWERSHQTTIVLHIRRCEVL